MKFFKKPPFWENPFHRKPVKKSQRNKLWGTYTRELKAEDLFKPKLRFRKFNLCLSAAKFIEVLKQGPKAIKKPLHERLGCLNVDARPGLPYYLNLSNHNVGADNQLTLVLEYEPWLSMIPIWLPKAYYKKSTNKLLVVYRFQKRAAIIDLRHFSRLIVELKKVISERDLASSNLPFKTPKSTKLYKILLKNLVITQDFYVHNSFKWRVNIIKTLAFKQRIFRKAVLKSKKKNKKQPWSKKPWRNSPRKNRRWFNAYSNNWFRYQNKKFKRFHSKFYFWKMYRHFPFYAVHKRAQKKLIQFLFAVSEKKISKAGKRIKNWTSHKLRLKNLLKSLRQKTNKKNKLQSATKKHKKESTTKLYKFKLKAKKKIKPSEIKWLTSDKTLIFNFTNPTIYSKYKLIKFLKADKKLFSKAEYLLRGQVKHGVLSDIIKLNLLSRLLFKPSKKPSKVFNKKILLSKAAFKKANSRLTYKLKWINHYEFKSFRWKFYKKRWYYTISKWKRLLELRRMVRKAWRSYRKLQKNFLFIKLLRANFSHILGLSEGTLLINWLKVRRGTSTDNSISTINYFNQTLQLKLDSFSLFLGLAPNRFMAQELVSFGGFRVNGAVVTKKNFSISNKDIVQVDLKVNHEIRALYKKTHWNSVQARIKFAQFLQVQWPLMLFMMVRWPNNHELASESILNLRWVRFFIRYFPVRIAKYKKAKTKWYKY